MLPLLADQVIGALMAIPRWSYDDSENVTEVSASVVGEVGVSEILLALV